MYVCACMHEGMYAIIQEPPPGIISNFLYSLAESLIDISIKSLKNNLLFFHHAV